MKTGFYLSPDGKYIVYLQRCKALFIEDVTISNEFNVHFGGKNWWYYMTNKKLGIAFSSWEYLGKL